MPEEKWKIIPGYPHYSVSDQGRVKSLRKDRILKPYVEKRGYPVVNLGGGNHKTIHSLVLLAFVGQKPQGKQGCHYNGVKTCNVLSNLRWGTSAENYADAQRHGTAFVPIVSRGEASPTSKLTNGQVHKIRLMRKFGKGMQEIADLFNITKPNVWRIVHRQTWTHI